MKSSQKTKTARVFLLLGSIACIFTSSCAMSEKEAGKRVAIAGMGIGATSGYLIGKKNGKTKGAGVKGAIIGSALGLGIGEEAGKRSSTLKGLGDVILPR